MRKLFYCVIVLMMVLIIASCSDHKGASELYDRVNAAILSNPDSALAQLQSMSSDISSSDEAMSCTYSLLCIKAKDKAYIPHESDSLILAILPYFEKNTDRLPEAYYYAGRVYSDMGDAPEALNYFEKALELLPDASRAEDVLRQKSVILSQMGFFISCPPFLQLLSFLSFHLASYRCSRDTFRERTLSHGLS